MWQTLGHPKLVNLFQRALDSGTLSHAYLLVGPPHLGKMSLALDLAMALNCQNEKDRPCQVCPSCQKIASRKHADIQIIGLSQNSPADETKEKTEIGIGQINTVLHSTNLPPFEGRYRVYIFEETFELSQDAANRLLKTLEEPPLHVIFLLLTADIGLIPSTIVSRCQRLNLARVATSEIADALTQRWQIDPEKAKLLARLSQGCPGWAITWSGSPSFLQDRRDKFEKMLTLVRGDSHTRFTAASQMALQFNKTREIVYETLETWIGWWRDVLLVKTGCPGNINNIDLRSFLVEMAGSFNLAQIMTAIQSLQGAAKQLKLNANARLALEVLMLNLPTLAVQSQPV